MKPTHGRERWPAGEPHSGDELVARVALVVVVLVGLLSIVCWCGAQLSALVSGNGWMSAGFTSGGSSLVALPRHISDPAGAWPEGARTALPGPIVYWTYT